MASFARSALSLAPAELSDISITTYQLAIVASLYPRPLLPRLLTPTHIAAIQIHTHHAGPSFSLEHISGATIANDTIKLIRQARAFGEYYSNLSTAQRRERSIYDNYRMLGWEFIEGMDIFEFEKCIGNWYFMERLELAGEEAHREMLEAGWRAYEQVPRHVKLGLGLLFREEDDDEEMVNGVDGVNRMNGANGVNGVNGSN